MRVKSRKPPAAKRSTSLLRWPAEVVGRADDGVGDEMRQVRGDGEDAVVVGRDPAARSGCPAPSRTLPACRPRRRRCRAAASGWSSGRRTARQSLPRGPEFSVPATGWAGTKCTPGRQMRLHRIDHGLLHRAHVGDDAARLELGRDRCGPPRRRRRPACRRSPGRRPRRRPRDRCRNGRPVSAGWRSPPSPRCAWQRRSWWRGRRAARRARSSRRSGRCRSARSCRTSAGLAVICLRRRSGRATLARP